MGTFMAGGLEEEVSDGKLNIIKEGNTKKFVNSLEQITFSAKNAIKNNQEVLFVTERAVFRLISDGIELIEFAPGIDIYNDIINQMEFVPIISNNLKVMDERIFRDEKMNLKI
jgi:propionate CoA-transferase